jgi:hypothetical protein
LIEIELPDGTILEAPDDADPSIVAKAYLSRQQVSAPGVAPPAQKATAPIPSDPRLAKLKDAALSLPDAALSLLSGSVAAPAAGLAGLASAPLVGMDRAADITRGLQDSLTYSPRTQGGQQLLSGISYPFQKLAEGADAAGGVVTGATGSPAAGAAVNTAIQALPLALGARLSPKPKATPLPTPLQSSVKRATDAGLSLTPQQANASVLARTLEGVGGSAKLERKMSLKNAPRVEDMIRQEIGIPKGAPINRASLRQAKVEPNKAYADVARAGRVDTDTIYPAMVDAIDDGAASGTFAFDRNPKIAELKGTYGKLTGFDASDAVQQVRVLRQRGNAKAFSPKYDVEQQAVGRAELKIADAIEAQLERHIAAGKSPDVSTDAVARLRDARIRLAQINSVQRAIKGKDVASANLARQQERGAPLSGNLKTIADAAQEFPRSFQTPSAIRNSTPVDFGDVLMGGLGLGASALNPSFLALSAMRPAARGLLAGSPYQRMGIKAAARPQGPIAPAYLTTGGYLPLMSQQSQTSLLGQQ